MTSKESTCEHLGTVLVTLLFPAPIIVVSGQSVALSGESDLMDTDMDGIDDRIDVLDDDHRIHSFGTRQFDAWSDWRHETISLSESVDKTLFGGRTAMTRHPVPSSTNGLSPIPMLHLDDGTYYEFWKNMCTEIHMNIAVPFAYENTKAVQ